MNVILEKILPITNGVGFTNRVKIFYSTRTTKAIPIKREEHQGALFEGTYFLEFAVFEEATFEYAGFRWAFFEREAVFRKTTFGLNADFSDAHFKATANFKSASFQERLSFKVLFLEKN